MTGALPHLDLSDPDFSTRGPEVMAARDQSWCARTPYGLAVLRHRQAGLLLRDRRLRQGSYAWPETIGLTGSFAEFWNRSLIALEGAEHKQMRQVALKALAPEFIETLVPAWTKTAEALVQTGEVEFMGQFARPFAGRAITTLLGISEDRADALAEDAITLGLGMAIDGKDHERAINDATDRLTVLAHELIGAPPKGRYVDRLIQSFADLGIEDHQARVDLIVISIFGGVDTTRAQLGFAMMLFAEHPAQWSHLARDPSLAEQAIDEVVRTRPTTTWATREAIETFEIEGVDVRAGETVHLLVHASGTDPAVGGGAGFDITQRRKRHFGFGGGAHHCLGQGVARADIGASLKVLCREIREIRVSGEPVCGVDSGNTGAHSLPLYLTAR